MIMMTNSKKLLEKRWETFKGGTGGKISECNFIFVEFSQKITKKLSGFISKWIPFKI